MSNLIMVVDDSQTIRKFVSASLSIDGFKVITASDGIDALEKLPFEKVDVIITDLNMPEMDGYEFIRALQETPQYRTIPVIILSSMTDDRHKELGLRLGAHVYVEKPFSAELIRQEVVRIIGLGKNEQVQPLNECIQN